MKRARPQNECTVETCTRTFAQIGDLVCPAHWKMVPRKLKTALWEAQQLRSAKDREWETIVAASNIVEYLTAKKIILPPETTLAKVGNLIETPDGIEKPADPTKRIITSSR